MKRMLSFLFVSVGQISLQQRAKKNIAAMKGFPYTFLTSVAILARMFAELWVAYNMFPLASASHTVIHFYRRVFRMCGLIFIRYLVHAQVTVLNTKQRHSLYPPPPPPHLPSNAILMVNAQ